MKHILSIIALCLLGFALAFSQSGAGGNGGFGGKGGSGGGTTAASGGTFTLRYATPASNGNCASTPCTVSLTAKAISAGDWLTYKCVSSLGVVITGVGNTGAGLTILPATFSEITSGGQMSSAIIPSAAAESTSDTITFSGSSGFTSCAIFDYSYTGSPVLDGANALEQAASSTTLVCPTFTPSGGSNNDIYDLMFYTPFTALASVSSPFTLVTGAFESWAYDTNTTSALGATGTWSGAESNTECSQVEVGFNVTAFQNMLFNNFSGTNGNAVTAATLASSAAGLRHSYSINGSGTFTYTMAASDPWTGTTGRLNDGSNNSDSSTVGVALATGTGSGSTYWSYGTTNGIITNKAATLGINVATTMPASSNVDDDSLVAYATGSADFVNAMLRGTGTNFFISMECGDWGQNTANDYGPITVGASPTFYHNEIIYSPLAGSLTISGTTATWATGSKFDSSLSLGTAVIWIAGGIVNTVGTAVTWSSGPQFNTGWTGTIVINGTTFTISSVASATAMTLTTSAGTNTGVPYSFNSPAKAETTAYTISSVNSGTSLTLSSAPANGTYFFFGSHYLKTYTGWNNPSSPGTLVNTNACATGGFNLGRVDFGNENANTLTTGFFVYFDGQSFSVDAKDPI